MRTWYSGEPLNVLICVQQNYTARVASALLQIYVGCTVDGTHDEVYGVKLIDGKCHACDSCYVYV